MFFYVALFTYSQCPWYTHIHKQDTGSNNLFFFSSAALKTHPDRVPADSPERPSRTRRFQLVNDAYFTLSDATRRREYDSQRKFYGGGRTSTAGGNKAGGAGSAAYEDPFAEADNDTQPGGAGAGPGAAQSAFSWAWNFFQNQAGGSGASGGATSADQQQQQQQFRAAEEQQFGDVFEEMLREQGMAEPNGTANNSFWSMLGGASGGALGFIVANVPGLLAGAVAGNRLGAIRDAKGKSVYAVFQVSCLLCVLVGDMAGCLTIILGIATRRSSTTSQSIGCQSV